MDHAGVAGGAGENAGENAGAGAGAAAMGAAGFDAALASRSFTLAINVCGSNGLARNPSQPTRAARS